MRQNRMGLLVAAGVCLLALTPAERAWADAIDGEWCHNDGRQMSIHGPEIVTPGGKRTKGDYDRHAFAYVVPAGEPGGGQTITMVLLNENNVRVSDPHPAAQPASTPGAVWHRCGKQISRAAAPADQPG